MEPTKDAGATLHAAGATMVMRRATVVNRRTITGRASRESGDEAWAM